MIIQNENKKDIILECLSRFIGDEGEWVEGWKTLFYKVNNNINLTDEDINDINECLEVCLGNLNSFRLQ